MAFTVKLLQYGAMPQPRLAFYLLGSPRLELDGAPIDVDTRKAIALAVYLGLAERAHTRDHLAAFFWPEADEAKAHAALRRTLSTLNKALAGIGLQIERETVALEHGADVWLDVAEFQHRLKQCQTHGHPAHEVCGACLTPLTQAAALYRDDFLSGFTLRDSPGFDDWQFFQSESLRRELAGVLEKLARCASEAGEPEAAIAHTRRWLALDPMHEPAHRQLMLGYARAGQRAAALRQYQECVRILAEELGVPPLEETAQLYEAIKANRLSEISAPASSNVAPIVQGLTLDSQFSNPLISNFPLVGRSLEWEAALKAYTTIQTDGCLLVLEGEAGIGKTRLAEGLLVYARGQGAMALTARCYEGEHNLAYGPFIEMLRSALGQARARLAQLAPHWLSEAARLLPELADLRPNVPPALALDTPGAQSRFFESVAQTLLALSNGQPTLIFIDDVHWLDEASLDLLVYLARRLRGHRLCLLVTWRTEDVPGQHRLRLLLAEAQRAGSAQFIELTRLGPAAVEELIRTALQSAIDKTIVERLYRETEGLPLFLIEYLATLQRESADAEWALPAGVRGLLQTRLASVGEAGGQLLSTAAVIGRSFDFDTLQAASGRSDEETVTALEALVARGLVRDVTPPAAETLLYDFNHDKLRALVYAETSLARRRLLHRRVAGALGARARGQSLAPLAGQIALHYRLAGHNAEAAHYYQLAGDHARALYANAEALTHYNAALALGHPDPASLHEALGDLQTLAGDYTAALVSYQTAAAHRPPEALAELEHKLGRVYERRGDGELAARHFETALSNGTAAHRARILADWSLTAHHRGQPARALELAQQALAEAGHDQRALAQAHNILGILASSRGEVAEAQSHLQHSLALAETLHDPSAQVAALNNLALAFSANQQVVEAIALAERALALCASQGDRHREAALHNNLADLLHTAGQAEAAMFHLKRAVALFAEVGKEAPTTTQPEIWKLTEW